MLKRIFESIWQKVPIEFSSGSNPPECPSCGETLHPSDFDLNEEDKPERLDVTNKHNDKYGGLECSHCGNTDIMTTDKEINLFRE